MPISQPKIMGSAKADNSQRILKRHKRPKDAPVSEALRQLDISDYRKQKLSALVKFTNAQLNEKYQGQDVAKLVDCMRDAFDTLQQFINEDVPEDKHAAVRDWFESELLTNNYDRLFSPPFSNDAQSDWAIQRRIRSLHWINAAHLECKIDESNAHARDHIYNAISELVAIDTLPTPQAKLDCIVRCCNCILFLLDSLSGRPASADDLLPALIFVILKANPVRLQSNINFIRNFTYKDRIDFGVCAYYFANFESAISFIVNLSHNDLKLPEREFAERMSDEKSCVSTWDTALLACDCFHVMQENLQRMKRLSSDADRMLNGVYEMRADLEQLSDSYLQRIEEALQIPLLVRPSDESQATNDAIVSEFQIDAAFDVASSDCLLDSLLDAFEDAVLPSPIKPST